MISETPTHLRHLRKNASSLRPLRLCGSFCCVMVTTGVQADDIRLKSAATVAGESIELAEVATLEGDYAESLAGVVIGPTDGKVVNTSVSLERVREALTEQGVNWAKLSLKGFAECAVTVQRAETVAMSAPLPSAQEVSVIANDATPVFTDLTTPMDAAMPLTVRGLIAAEIERLTGLPSEQMVVEFRGQDEALLDRSTIAAGYTVRATDNAMLGNIPFRVERHDLGGAETFSVLASVKRRVLAVVATRPITRGQRLGDADVAVREVLIDRDDQAWLDDTTAVLGATARKNLSIGQVVSGGDLSTPPIVQRGQLVTLRVESGSIGVEGQGFAEQDGTLGDTVRVRRGQDRRGPVVLGTVVAPGKVDVLVARGVEGNRE